jgi:hypothetical protein
MSFGLRGMPMNPVSLAGAAVACGLVLKLLAASTSVDGTGPETFTALATVKTASGGTANAPITIVIDRKMSQAEADVFTKAFKAGGTPALRKKLEGVLPTGSVRLGSGTSTATRLTLERITDKGRLLTIVVDQPLFFLGAGAPEAKPTGGYDFAIIDIEVDGAGRGSGTLAPAAKVMIREDAFVVEDYSSDLVQLTDVRKVP